MAAAAGVCSDTAVITTIAGLGAETGAVYSPDELMVPVAADPPITPLTSQITPLFAVLATVAASCWEAPACTMTDCGVMLTATCGTVTVTTAEAVAAELACDTAVTVTIAGLGTEAGAAYSPAGVI